MAAQDRWRTTPARDRAAVLFRAAEWMRVRRDELAALEIFEAGKPWDQSDGDVCEAIDFCEYYGRQMLRLDAGGDVDLAPGRDQRAALPGQGRRPQSSRRGTSRSPSRPAWRRPHSSPATRSSSSPPSRRPLVAWKLVEAFVAAGVPKGVFQFLPGLGEDVGARLVDHPDVAHHRVHRLEGGRAAHRRAGRASTGPASATSSGSSPRWAARTRSIIDADADPDQAVPAAVVLARSATPARSARPRRGSSCSTPSTTRSSSGWSAPDARSSSVTRRSKATKVGPVIDADAYKRLTAAIERAHLEGRVLLQRDDVPDGGWYIGPTIVDNVDPATAQVARDELFGPVLAVLRARDFDHAIELANDTEYALTGGVFSRSPAHIATGRGRAAGRQRLRQPPHHRGGRRAPAVRRLRHVGGGFKGGRARLSPPVPRSAGRHGEHHPPGVRARDMSERSAAPLET